MSEDIWFDLSLEAIRAHLPSVKVERAGQPAAALLGPAAGRRRTLSLAVSESSRTLIRYAQETYTGPLLYWYLRSLAATGVACEADAGAGEALCPLGASSASPGEGLRELYYATAARKAALLRLLEDLLDAFAARGIAVVLLKGAALEASLSLPPALRVMADVDLLVRPDCLGAAERVLVERGLAPACDASTAALMRERGYHLTPYVGVHGTAVELHREVLPRAAPFRLRAAELWRESRPVVWRDREVRVPSPAHLFIHTCIHSGYAHTRGVALRRLWDLALVSEGLPLDRRRLEVEAMRCGASRLVRSALSEVQALDQGTPAARSELGRRLRDTDDLWADRSPVELLRARARQLDHTRQRLALVRHTLLPPREETANATGCRSGATHLCRFLHPRRLLRGVLGLKRNSPAGGELTREGEQAMPIADRADRCREIDARLEREYPGATCALEFEAPFQLLVATILSAQCTDERVNMVTPGLFARYPGPEAFLQVPQETIEQEIHSTGFFRNKAKSIQGACRRIVEVYGGEVPRTMEELLTLPGVARKTANVVLGTAYGLAEGIAVDTHVRRLSGRLGLTDHDQPEKIEVDLMALLPRDRWTGLSHQLILHGRQVCHARRPECTRCCLSDLCPTYLAGPAAEGEGE